MMISISNTLQKEAAVRKRISNIFNKREEDFPSLTEYNSYLEEIEEMIYNLAEGIDVSAIEEKIAKYEEENSEQIIISRARKAEDLDKALREADGPTAVDGASDMIIDQNSQATGATGAGQYAPAMFIQPRPTGAAQPVPIGANSNMPEDEESQRQRAEKGARAGGWSPDFCRKRAFEEAFSSLWIS